MSTQYHTTSYLTYLSISYHIISCRTNTYCTISNNTISYQSSHIISTYTILQHTRTGSQIVTHHRIRDHLISNHVLSIIFDCIRQHISYDIKRDCYCFTCFTHQYFVSYNSIISCHHVIQFDIMSFHFTSYQYHIISHDMIYQTGWMDGWINSWMDK